MTQVLMEIIASGCLLALVSFGLVLIYRSGRVLHLAHASTYTVGGYAGVLLLNHLGGLPWLAGIGAAGAAAATGAAIEAGVYRPLRRRRATPDVLFLASVGIVAVVAGGAGLTIGSDLLLARAGVGDEVIGVGSARISMWRATTIGLTVVLLMASFGVLRMTRLGVLIRAVGADADLARSSGVDVGRIRLLAMATGSGLAGIAAFLLAADAAVTPNSGLRTLLLAFTAMVIGGARWTYGPVLGAFAVASVQQVTGRFWDPAWQDGIVFAVLVLVLLARRGSLLGGGS